MECCSAYSCVIGDPSKASVSNNTYNGNQSHLFFKRVSFGLPLKVKMEKSGAPVVYKSTTCTAMAQQQTCGSSPNSIIQVIDSKYCVQYPIDLGMVKKITNLIYSDYLVSHQLNKTINFYGTRDSNSFHHDFVLHDSADDEPLVTLRKKIFTTQERWQVFRGPNTNDKNLLFSVKKSSVKHSLDVYLPFNIMEDVCDFKITKNGLSKDTFEVYMGDNNIAKIQKKDNENILFGQKDKLMLYVYPDVDYAFVVALSVIVNEMDCLEDCKLLPSNQLFQRPIKFMARLLGVFIATTKFMARLLRKAMPTFSTLGIGLLFFGLFVYALIGMYLLFQIIYYFGQIPKV